MKIDEAIEILQDDRLLPERRHTSTFNTALQLGIEALKERQEAINQGLPLWHELLPGETKD